MTAMNLHLQGAGLRRGGRQVLRGVTLSIEPGEFLVVVGPNGAGKTSLLSLLAGDLRPTDGQVWLDGRALRDWTPLDLARRRAVLRQANQLGFPLPVRDVVALGRSPWRDIRDRTVNDAAIDAALVAADVRHLVGRSYAALSGGEQQRTQLARTIAQLDTGSRPAPILLLDEPTASLDLSHAHAVLQRTRGLAHNNGVAVVAVLHDLGLAWRYADRVLVLRNGSVAGLGTPHAVFTPALLSEVFAVEAAIHDGYLVVHGPVAA